VRYGRFRFDSLRQQVRDVRRTSRYYNRAVVRAIQDYNDGMLVNLEVQGCYVQRVKFTQQARSAAIDDLSMLISKRRITLAADVELEAQLQVFKSEFALDEKPDYSSHGAQSAILAVCLVTYDFNADFDRCEFRGSIYYSYDPTLF